MLFLVVFCGFFSGALLLSVFGSGLQGADVFAGALLSIGLAVLAGICLLSAWWRARRAYASKAPCPWPALWWPCTIAAVTLTVMMLPAAMIEGELAVVVFLFLSAPAWLLAWFVALQDHGADSGVGEPSENT